LYGIALYLGVKKLYMSHHKVALKYQMEVTSGGYFPNLVIEQLIAVLISQKYGRLAIAYL